MKDTANEFRLRFSDIPEIAIPANVHVRKANKHVWPVLEGITIVKVEIPAREMRAPHLHTNASELSVIVRGTAVAVLITPEQERLTVELAEGDCVYFPQGWVHWLINTSEDTLISYFNYSHEQPITEEVEGVDV